MKIFETITHRIPSCHQFQVVFLHDLFMRTCAILHVARNPVRVATPLQNWHLIVPSTLKRVYLHEYHKNQPFMYVDVPVPWILSVTVIIKTYENPLIQSKPLYCRTSFRLDFNVLKGWLSPETSLSWNPISVPIDMSFWVSVKAGIVGYSRGQKYRR